MANYQSSYTGAQHDQFVTSQQITNLIQNEIASVYPGKNSAMSTGAWNIAARQIIGDNDAASPQYALLRSGPNRENASPSGDTWIYYDDRGSVSTPWGIRHNQGSDTIGFVGNGVERTSINLNNGFVNTNGAYGQKKWTAFTSSGTGNYEQTITITTHGRPVFLILSGDSNPTSATAWHRIRIYRGDTLLTAQICESHAASWNIPFCVCYLDIVGAGSYTYKGILNPGSGTIQFGEEGNVQAPQFIAFEI